MEENNNLNGGTNQTIGSSVKMASLDSFSNTTVDTMKNDNNQQNNNLEQFDIGDFDKKNKKLVILSLVVLLLGIVFVFGFSLYRYFSKNPTEIIKTVIENTYRDFSKGLESYKDIEQVDFDLLNESFSLNGNLAFKNPKYNGLEKEKINFLMNLDYAKKKAKLGAGLIKDGSKLLDANIYMINDKAYMKSDTLFDNIYRLEGNFDFDSMFDLEDLKKTEDIQISIEDIDFIAESLKDALIGALDKSQMTLSKEKIKINGKNIDSNKIVYNLSKESLENLNSKLVENILNNDDVIRKMAQVSGTGEIIIRDGLEAYRDEEILDEGEFVIYTKGVLYEVAKIEFKFGDNLITGEFDGDYANIFFEMNGEVYNVEVNKNDDGYEVMVRKDSLEILTLNISKFENEEITFDYEVSYENTSLTGSVNVEIEKKDEDITVVSIEFSIDGLVNKEKIDFAFILDYEMTKNAKMDDIDISEVLDGSSITEADQAKMFQKLSSLESTQLYSYVMDLVGGMVASGL